MLKHATDLLHAELTFYTLKLLLQIGLHAALLLKLKYIKYLITELNANYRIGLK